MTFSKTTYLSHPLTYEMLNELCEQRELQKCLKKIAFYLKKITKMEAVAIRLYLNGDFPYITQIGYPDSFITEENVLCDLDFNGIPCINPISGENRLECLCGAVISKNFSDELPCFTKNGSFFSNNIVQTYNESKNPNCIIHPRNACIHFGYRSMALIPINYKELTLGLLQFNDSNFDKLDPELIQFLELFGDILSSRIMNFSEFIPPERHYLQTLTVPICSICKRIRFEKKWMSFENYFSIVENVKKIKFSHGLCADCLKNYYDDKF